MDGAGEPVAVALKIAVALQRPGALFTLILAGQLITGIEPMIMSLPLSLPVVAERDATTLIL